MRLEGGYAPGGKNEKEKALMPLYEHVFLARQDISTQQVETLMKEYQLSLIHI